HPPPGTARPPRPPASSGHTRLTRSPRGAPPKTVEAGTAPRCQPALWSARSARPSACTSSTRGLSGSHLSLRSLPSLQVRVRRVRPQPRVIDRHPDREMVKALELHIMEAEQAVE